MGRLAIRGHANPATTARYAHLAANPVCELNDRIGGVLEGALAGGKRPDQRAAKPFKAAIIPL